MKVVIVGGGLSGLATAYLLMEKNRTCGKFPLDITVLESDSRAGGKLWSENVDGFLCERGPNGFLDNKPWTLDLCDRLGIANLLVETNDSARKRFIYSEDMLHLLPESVPAFFFKSKILSVVGRLRILLEPFTRRPDEAIDETVADFVKRHIGEESLRKLVGPMVSGVFAGDPFSLSLKSSFPIMHDLEREGSGSLVIAMLRRMLKRANSSTGQRAKKKAGPTGPGGTLTSFKDGIEHLIRVLGERLGDWVVTCTEVQRIENGPSKGRSYVIYYKNQNGGGEISTDVVILATPAYITAGIIGAMDPAIASTLNEIPYPPLDVVCFGYRRELISHPLDGFGFLIPHEERMNMLGCLWDSSMYEARAPEGYVLLRAMLGGARSPEAAGRKEDVLINAVRRDLKVILGIDAPPDFIKIYRYEKAIPQYVVGHSDRMKLIEEALKRHPGVFLTGNSYFGIGINHCAREALVAAEKVMDYCSRDIG